MVVAWVTGTSGSLERGKPGVTALCCSGEDEEWVSKAHRPAKEGIVGSCLEEEVTRRVAVGNRPWSALCLPLIRS
jgi:hypothetical protein